MRRLVLPRIGNTVPGLSVALDLVRNAFDRLLGEPFIDGQLVEDITVTGGAPFLLNHGLGRIVKGVVVTSVVGSAFVDVRMYPAAFDPNTQVALIPSGTGVISLWLF